MWIKNTALSSAYIISVGVVILVYWAGLHGPFVFDDLSNILLAPAVRLTEVSGASLYEAAFWQQSTSFGRPIAMLSFALNYYFTQFNPFPYKLTNLVIHVCNGAVLVGLSVYLLRRIEVGNKTVGRLPIAWLALIVGCAWALHPLNVTSVLYVVQRMTSLATLFTLVGLIGYVYGRERMLANRKFGFRILVSTLVFFTAVATLTKENGILLPAYALLIEVIFYRFAEPARGLKLFWATLTALAIAAILFLAFTGSLSTLLSYQYRDFTLSERLLTEARALWFYIKLILLPQIAQMGLYHDDFVVSQSLLTPPSTAIAILGLFFLIAVATVSYNKAPILCFSILWFLIGHSVESTIIPLELVHEHRNYLPQYGILFALIYYFHLLINARGVKIGLVTIYLALLSTATYARAIDWQDEWTLYNKDVVNHPKSVRAQTMLGIILHDNAQYALARPHFIAAANLDPRDAKTMIRLVQHFYEADAKVPEELLQELEERLRLFPYSGITLWTFEPLLKKTTDNLALNLRLIKIYEQTINRKDIDIGAAWREVAFRTLGFAYREQRRYRDAISYFDKAVAINPAPVYHLVAAELYIKLGDALRARAEIAGISKDDALNDDEKARLRQIKQALKYIIN